MRQKTLKAVVLGVFFTATILLFVFLFKFKNIFEENAGRVIPANLPENQKEHQIKIDERKNLSIKESPFASSTILFVGDVMFDRGVEYLVKKNGAFYPFEKIYQFLNRTRFVVGNLEGPIVENPVDFPDASLKFAFPPQSAGALSFANFGLLSLANNHALNMGETGLLETKSFLRETGIDFVGHPFTCFQDFLSENQGISFLAFNKTFPFNCSDDEIAGLVRETRVRSPENFLAVILHWGGEYQPESNVFQRNLAHQLIEAGADLIIGSHPHVVQEIEGYKEGIIFYSLGNFVFDQYFSKETQLTLLVGLELREQAVLYRLFPASSWLSQPFLMTEKEAREFLETLAQKSSPQLFSQIKDGMLTEFKARR